jgi:hypothetical protein
LQRFKLVLGWQLALVVEVEQQLAGQGLAELEEEDFSISIILDESIL